MIKQGKIKKIDADDEEEIKKQRKLQQEWKLAGKKVDKDYQFHAEEIKKVNNEWKKADKAARKA